MSKNTIKEAAIFVAIIMMVVVGHTLSYHLDTLGGL